MLMVLATNPSRFSMIFTFLGENLLVKKEADEILSEQQ
jgi:hypothetical protein